jgi:hypothetical protein
MNVSSLPTNATRQPAVLLNLVRQVLSPMILLAALAGSAHAGETSFKHKYLMRGQILEADAGALVVCVGKEDGAEVGQVLDIVRYVREMGNPKESPKFRRVEVGSVKVTSLFDDHYATAEVVDGSPKVNDIVELKRP